MSAWIGPIIGCTIAWAGGMVLGYVIGATQERAKWLTGKHQISDSAKSIAQRTTERIQRRAF